MRENLKQLLYILMVLRNAFVVEFRVRFKAWIKVPLVKAWTHLFVLPVRRIRLRLASKLVKKREPGVPTKPVPGWEWSPMLSYPRNRRCYCGADRKYKHCHGPGEVRVVTKEKADFLRGYMREAGVA